MKPILLHTCCGACGFIATKFLEAKFNINYFWFNPNIDTIQEHEKRLDVARKNFSVIVDEYNSSEGREWLDNFQEFAYQQEKRCKECYRFRLTRTVNKAKELKIDWFSTTLLVSPYQKHEILKKVAGELADINGLKFYYFDGRTDFYKNLTEFKKLGFYTQKYCGCKFSKNEK
ncbi:MAG: epoxyqueuosine reductase QueH [Elusimicrobiota bacterium]